MEKFFIMMFFDICESRKGRRMRVEGVFDGNVFFEYVLVRLMGSFYVNGVVKGVLY